MYRYFLSLLILSFTFLSAQAPSVVALSKQEELFTPNSEATVMHLGDHIIAEFHGCQSLNAIDKLADVLRQAAEIAGATVLHVETHHFEPMGMSGVAILSESHISVHTWPEYGYAAIDMYTCGDHVHPELGIEYLAAFFKPKKVRKISLVRGFDVSSLEQSVDELP